MIILGATPIGNLGDASGRLREALATAPVIAAEDTRTARQLMRALGIDAQPQLVALHEHNEEAASPALVERARDEDVLVLTDAGMPTVSDPGFRLVQAAVAAGVAVTCLPGPSAVLTALALSGLPTDRFAFDGFLPRKGGERDRMLAALAREERTVVLFEAPHRLTDALEAIDRAMPGRRVAVCRELTKRYEEVRRGTAAELLPWAREGVKGEIVLVLEGAAPVLADLDAAVQQVLGLKAAGMRLKEAAAEVAEATGHPRNALYRAALTHPSAG
ncbi:16S rRNA (cytidine(1402)-2'-O)-methyltransferase [Agrococcus sp. SCSIO52902]|uniref:16S rRNA (cytidine(1402)-2'-O)-methyltransferase n=1 Tax=Agrococcus sp. SCSIO52902 TaxID=2933290 RepID=UPI001FF33C8B|nr:16S rRNA (cytidine(1402)-2'-O)-methyltransferase [Agrococcus sp. SCSIO52902]UOV99908.1 16S rRNA (cytidine(1402)-2'-O)-methyltransferase [Agrococcus sp. SCSIO52902]